MNTSLILIGPISAGKTTLQKMLAEKLDFTPLDLDDLRSTYYPEIGYDNDEAERLREKEGLDAMLAYWKPFELHAVERVLREYPSGHVIAFGAGHSVYDDAEQFARAQQALAPFPRVVLLLPSPDVDESVAMLGRQMRAAIPDVDEQLYALMTDLNRTFVPHPSNARLAKLTVYTKGKTPAQTCDEIVERLQIEVNK